MHKELSDWCTIPCGYFVFYRLVKAADEMYVLLSGCPRSKNMKEILLSKFVICIHTITISYFMHYIRMIKRKEAGETLSKL